MPTYNEEPDRVLARAAGDLRIGRATGPARLLRLLHPQRHHRPRRSGSPRKRPSSRCATGIGATRASSTATAPRTIARKAGNIADWVPRWGGAYEHMIVLDADSLMTGDTLLRLAARDGAHPDAGLIQTLPVIVNAQHPVRAHAAIRRPRSTGR